MVPRLQSVLSGSALSLDQRALTGVDLGNIRLSLSSSNPDKLLSPSLRTHPGEISFPGGHEDPGIDQSLLGTALREATKRSAYCPKSSSWARWNLCSITLDLPSSGLLWCLFIHLIEPNQLHHPIRYQ
ncbi:hypothetical protein H4Q26_013719 [Puccinia striiformis f. sp. tritici PST-130]|nr:hypothetical protein H4Q26_013719 [Puccinia striiformis f. sp. tritici PST-130]